MPWLWQGSWVHLTTGRAAPELALTRCRRRASDAELADRALAMSGYGSKRLRRPVCKNFSRWRLTGSAEAVPVLLSLTRYSTTESAIV